MMMAPDRAAASASGNKVQSCGKSSADGQRDAMYLLATLMASITDMSQSIKSSDCTCHPHYHPPHGDRKAEPQ